MEQSWIPNKEILHGIVVDVDDRDGVITLKIDNQYDIFVPEDHIKLFWIDKGFDYHKFAEGSVTKRLPGAKHKDKKW